MFFDWRIGSRLAGLLGIGGVTNGAIDDPILPGTVVAPGVLMCDRGEYLLTGNNVNLIDHDVIFIAPPGAYTQTGKPVNFEFVRKLSTNNCKYWCW